jgi:hypothetical protein
MPTTAIQIISYQVRWAPFEGMVQCDLYDINDLDPLYHYLQNLEHVRKISVYFMLNGCEYTLPFRVFTDGDKLYLAPDYDWSMTSLSDSICTGILSIINTHLDTYQNNINKFSSYLVVV